MGHQVYLIAKVKARGSDDPTCRYIAGYYRHHCSGSVPIRASLRLFSLLKQPDNADVVREEVRALDGLYGAPGKDPQGPGVPCRFLATILGSSWDIYKEDIDLDIGGTWLHANLLSANSTFWGGHNSDGLTVIDVTDPQNPGCSFFEHRNNEPQTAMEYLVPYYPDEIGPNPRPIEQCRTTRLRYNGDGRLERVAQFTDEQLLARRAARRTWLLGMVNSFQDIPPLTVEMLRQAWPTTFRSTVESKATLAVTDCLRNDARIPSLMDSSLREAVKDAVITGDFSPFNEAVWFSSKLEIISDTLRSYSTFPDAAVPLLSQLIQGWKRNNALSIDLSGFNISDSQLAVVIPDLDDIRTISLSFNPRITTVSLELMLERLQHLRRLFIMRCPGITDQDFTTLWCAKQKLFGKLDALYHPLLLRGELYLPPPITLVSTKPFEFTTPATSPMIASPAVVVQSLIDLWEMFDPQYFAHIRGRVYEVIWVTPRAPNQTWDERGVACSFLGFPWSTLASSFSSWLVVVRPQGGPPEWAFVPYTVTVTKEIEDEGAGKPIETYLDDEAEDAGSSDSESAQSDSDEEDSDYEPENPGKNVEIGELHTLREYLRKMVEEEGKLPAPEELVSTLEAKAERLHVRLMEKETVMGCLFGAK